MFDVRCALWLALLWGTMAQIALGFGVAAPAKRRTCSVCVDTFVTKGGCRPHANIFSLISLECAHCRTEAEAKCATAPAGPCANWPCSNGGQCVDKTGHPGTSNMIPIGSRRREQSIDKNFTCHCKDGYTGLTCEVVFGAGGSRDCPTNSFEVSEQECRALGRIEFPLDDEDGNDVFGDIQTSIPTRRLLCSERWL